LNPRPSLSTISLAYSRYYTHAKSGGVDYATASWWRRFRIAQRNGYLNANYGYALKPAVWNPVFLSRARRRRFDSFAGYLHFPGRGARMLDIGCGNGIFLWQMRSLGWEVCGVEPDPQSAAQAREIGLDVRTGLLQQQSLPEAHFDAITMVHVIEHLHDPMDTLRLCWKLLKPGGRITIATPNLGSCGHRHFTSNWRDLDPPRHLVLFTENSLRHALEACGFKVSRPPRPSLNARELFKAGAILQRGGKPMERHPRLPWSVAMRAKWLAAKADRAARKNPAYAEELILLGTKMEGPSHFPEQDSSAIFRPL
jgi:2-polyprenyl-3-methyl-5-hydroxy-6-metoxy-1,4-benzoquinol methylase